jgi:PAS domain S-box-containing protein
LPKPSPILAALIYEATAAALPEIEDGGGKIAIDPDLVTRTRWLLLARLCALIPLLSGATAITGWLVAKDHLVRVLPGSLPIQLPTATGFLLGSIGLLLASTRHARLAAVCGGFMGLIDIGVLGAQYSDYQSPMRWVLDWFSRSDFLHAGVGSKLSSPCLGLTSIALVLLSNRRARTWQFAVLGLCGSVIVTLSLGVYIAYLLGIAGPNYVPILPQISLVAAGSFLAISVSILLLALHRESEGVGETLLRWLPVFAGVASVGITLYLQMAFSAEAHRYPETHPGGPHARLASLLMWGGLAVSALVVATLLFALRLRSRTQQLELSVKRHTTLASLIAMSRDFIAMANPESEITYLNAAAKSLVGLEDPKRGQPVTILDFFPPEAAAKVRDEIMPALLRDGWVRTETFLRHFRTGQLIPVDMEGVVVKDPQGSVIALGTVTRDLTERSESEKHRARLEMQLAQAQKMEALGRLTAGIAHDFNNSLTVILGYAQILASSDRLTDEEQRAVSAIHGAGMNSESMVKQLMGFSRQQVIAPQILSLNRMLLETEPLLKRLVGEDIEIRTVRNDAPSDVFLDPSQVNQVLMNMAANARDAMPDGGELTLETSNASIDAAYAKSNPLARPGEYVVLAISDTGTGMSSETIARIFEPFFTTKEKDLGTGLGLATVYGIVRQNNGFINVYSELQHGTTFKVHFPRSLNAAKDAPEPKAEANYRAPGPRRCVVLLVEDDDLVRNMTKNVLEMLGYTPAVTGGAAAALDICGMLETPIDLVISDVILPDMKGTELRDRVVRLRPGLPFLFVSGYTSNVIVQNGVLKPGVHFLQKPFTLEGLDAKIRSILGANDARPQREAEA